MIPYTLDSYRLLHEGSLALSQVEASGMRIDTAYLDRIISKTKKRIVRLARKLEEAEEVKIWKKKYRSKFNLNSGEQLAFILFEVLGHRSEERTEKGRPKTDDESLEKLNIPFVADYLYLKKMQKALTTYLVGIQREVVDGFIHPNFNLNTVSTFRSSSDNPNFQNIPVRDEEIGRMVRTAFIPRKGRRIIETDAKGIEVTVAACYHKDPAMIEYIVDESKDMHRDMAMECYKLKQSQVGKKIRYCGKNMFVFPQFYGDWYISCAESLWNAMDKLQLTTEDGILVRDHLFSKGIKRLGKLDPKEKPILGTFEHHIQQVERRFWEVRFPIYTQWKKRWYEAYKKKGWFLTKTGFICQGHMKKNEVINYPVQGSAFHCLLECLIELVRVQLVQRKMKSLIVGQIHDSIVGDVPEEETDEYCGLMHELFTKRLKRIWDWIIIPLKIEIEAAPIDQPWSLKEPYHA